MTWVSWLIIVMAGLVLCLDAIYIYYSNNPKRWLRLFSSVAVFYTGILYLLSVATDLIHFPDQGPIFARPALLILLALLGSETYYDLARRQ